MAPGLDYYFKSPEPEPPVARVIYADRPLLSASSSSDSIASKGAQLIPAPERPLSPGVYYNSRFDPENFLDGPLSWDPATRLRQMLARPGIVVRILIF